MTKETFIELVNREIDGEISSTESSELAAYVAADPQRQAEYEELIHTGKALQKIRQVEPPPDLKKNIIAALRPMAPARTTRVHTGESWIETIRTKLQASVGYAFAGGALAGAALLAFVMVVEPQWLETGSGGTVATIGIMEKLDEFPLIDRLQISSDEVAGSIETRASELETIVNIVAASDRPVRLLIECDSPAAGFVGFYQTGSESATAQLSKRAVEIAHSGSNSYVIVVQNPTGQVPPMRVRIFADSLIFEAVLTGR